MSEDVKYIAFHENDQEGVNMTLTATGVQLSGWCDGLFHIAGGEITWEELDKLRQELGAET